MGWPVTSWAAPGGTAATTTIRRGWCRRDPTRRARRGRTGRRSSSDPLVRRQVLPGRRGRDRGHRHGRAPGRRHRSRRELWMTGRCHVRDGPGDARVHGDLTAAEHGHVERGWWRGRWWRCVRRRWRRLRLHGRWLRRRRRRHQAAGASSRASTWPASSPSRRRARPRWRPSRAPSALSSTLVLTRAAVAPAAAHRRG